MKPLFEDTPREWAPEEFDRLQEAVYEMLLAFADFAGRPPTPAEQNKMAVAIYMAVTEPTAPMRAQ